MCSSTSAEAAAIVTGRMVVRRSAETRAAAWAAASAAFNGVACAVRAWSAARFAAARAS